MRTEQDLRAAFDHLADTAPHASRITTDPVRRGVARKSRPLLVGAVVATTIAAIAVPLTVSSVGRKPPIATQTPNDNWRIRLSLPPVSGYALDERLFTSTNQSIGLGPSKSGGSCQVTSYRPGEFDPARIPVGSPRVKIGDLDGYLATLPPDPARLTGRQKTIVWKLRSGTWMTSWCGTSGKDESTRAQQLANAVDTAQRPLLTPYRIGFLPAGLSVQDLIQSPARGAPSNFTTSLTAGHGQVARIQFDSGPDAGRSRKANPKTLEINGHPAAWIKNGQLLAVYAKDFAVYLTAPMGSPIDHEQLIKIAQGLQLAPSTETGSWFDAATAIP